MSNLFQWRQQFGGLKSDQLKRLKDLEAENARLRRAISDLTLDMVILALRLARAGFYVWLRESVSSRSREEARLMGLIRHSHAASPGV